jgi:hypothetical protein
MKTYFDDLRTYTDVDAQQFSEFIDKHELTPVQGAMFRSSFYLNKDGQILAYRETSSYNSNIKYKIKTEDNFETLNLVKNIINSKEI